VNTVTPLRTESENDVVCLDCGHGPFHGLNPVTGNDVGCVKCGNPDPVWADRYGRLPSGEVVYIP
jgi:hypothetical protein